MRTHIEMQSIDFLEGWMTPKGFPPGLEVKVLADDLDEHTKTGARTRFVRFAPGAITVDVLAHSYWEEVYLLSGDMYPLDGPRGISSSAPLYSLRPPGTPHGPFGSDSGCMLFEIQYYLK